MWVNLLYVFLTKPTYWTTLVIYCTCHYYGFNPGIPVNFSIRKSRDFFNPIPGFRRCKWPVRLWCCYAPLQRFELMLKQLHIISSRPYINCWLYKHLYKRNISRKPHPYIPTQHPIMRTWIGLNAHNSVNSTILGCSCSHVVNIFARRYKQYKSYIRYYA